MYGLNIIGVDVDGAYLITHTKTPIAIHTPEGWYCSPGYVYMVYGNLYGLATAGNTFSKSFDECIDECSFDSTPSDSKIFWKWHEDGQITILIAHSDDFRMFFDIKHQEEYDGFCAALVKRGYKIMVTTDKPFVGLEISQDEDGHYYMSQKLFKKQVIKLAVKSRSTLPYLKRRKINP